MSNDHPDPRIVRGMKKVHLSSSEELEALSRFFGYHQLRSGIVFLGPGKHSGKNEGFVLIPVRSK